MTADTAAAASRTIGPTVVPLLALAILINYVDRGNLATAAPLIKDQLRLTNTQIGLLLSAFFWSYTPAQILAGWLTERINAYWTLAVGLAIWGVATAASGLAMGFASLLILRVLLGVGESAAFPCSSKLLAQHLPLEKLGAANGLILVGLGLGPAFGTFVGGLMMTQFGWRAVFVVFGLVSLLWLLPWWTATRHATAHAAAQPDGDAPSYAAIVRCREAWGASLGHFSANYAFYFVISWLPLYLVKTRGLSVTEMAEIGGLIYIGYAASTFLTGWLSDRWIAAGADAGIARKAGAILSLAVVAASLLTTAAGDTTVSIASLFCAGIALGIGLPNNYAIAQTLAGPRAAGKWMGFENCIANIAGIIGPIVTGIVVDRTGQFYWAFVVAGAVALVGILGWGVLIRKVEPVRWQK